MYLNYANSLLDKPEGNRNNNFELLINSCGTYRLYNKVQLPTFREKGRIDYQLIYLVSGKGYFYFHEGVPTMVNAGTMVLFRPEEPQRYIFYGKDKPDIYWIHFTGSAVEESFQKYGINCDSHIISTDTRQDSIVNLFKQIIWELQTKKVFFQDSTTLYFKQLLILLGRHNSKYNLNEKKVSSIEIEEAVSYFYEHYSENINVEEYVDNFGLSISSFFRKFKLYTGMTPLQYILDIRLTNAKNLLKTSDYSVNEIALIVGYDNPLYFSRLFHKHTGLSPIEYRKQEQNF